MTSLQEAFEAIKQSKWVDLTHQINEKSPHFPALPALGKKDIFTLKDGFHVQEFSIVGQYGTHIDAPIHFVEGGAWLDEIDQKDLFLPIYVIDRSAQVANDPNFILSKQDVLDFEQEHGPITPGSFVAFRSDWSKRWPNQDAMQNLNADGHQETPGWSLDALDYLIHDRQVKAVGHETFDTDSGLDVARAGGKLEKEYYLLAQGIYQLEVLANLDQLPPSGAFIHISFPNWEKATGSPVRAIAYLPD